MDLDKLRNEKHCIIAHKIIEGKSLTIKETAQYRWFEYGGNSIQSLMSLSKPEQLISPIYQSLLLFLLWVKGPINLLNLGLGGASIERALSGLPEIKLTAVESSPYIIEMAKRHFHLSENVELYCQNAEQYIRDTKSKYNIVLCDLFIAEKSPEFLFSHNFYFDIAKIVNKKAVIILNIQADNEQQLMHALLAIKEQFPHIALIEFDDFVNIVLICSSYKIPEPNVLQNRLKCYRDINFNCLNDVIKKMRIIA